MGYDNFNYDLDLINLTKRLKLHGITFYQRLSAKQKRLSAQLAGLRGLKPKINDSIAAKKDTWEQIESIEFQDRFKYAFLIRFERYFRE